MAGSSTIPILMYHGVDALASVVTLPPNRFRWQMEWLYRHGYKGISLGEIVRCMSTGETFPERAVVLTFDDGYQSVYAEAFPVLKQYGFSATVFLVTDFCNKDNRWHSQPQDIPTMKLMTWGQIDEMARFGIEFGSHTLTHPYLDQLPPDALHDEIVLPKTILEEKLSRPVTVFAYPYGRYSKPAKELVASVYEAACSTRQGLAHPTSDRFMLERVEISYLAHPWAFQSLFHSMFPYYLSIRKAGRTLRSAVVQMAGK